MGVDDGMVTLNGVRYRLDDAIAWGLYDPEPQGRHVAPEEGATEGEEGPVTAAAPPRRTRRRSPRRVPPRRSEDHA